MTAAIYARKSNDQTGTAEEAKSVARQIEHAKIYATAKGWTVDERFVFVDDGISGAEFDKRPGFLRLMNSLTRPGTPGRVRAPFQVLIVSELSRLGREQFETGYALKQLSQAGVGVWSYLEQKEILLDTATNKFLMSVVNYAAEIEREKTAQRVTDAHLQRARLGRVTGGKVFGYDNVRIAKGHVDHQINAAEATVVVKIFEMAAAGCGLRQIAHTLNLQGAPAPRAQRGRPSGWQEEMIRAVLVRSLYRGQYEYNHTKKSDAFGKRRGTLRPESDLIRVEQPELRIVSAELAATTDAMRLSRRQRYLRGAQHHGHAPVLGKYLLSGLLRCACGSNFQAQKNQHGTRQADVYCCSANRRKGAAVCGNSIALPIAETEERILGVIEHVVLTPAFVDIVLNTVFVPDAVNRPAAEAEIRELERQMTNLTTAIKIGGNLQALVDEMTITQARIGDLRSSLEPRLANDRESLRAAIEQRVDDWKGVLRGHPIQARQVLHHLLNGPIQIRLSDGADLQALVDAGIDLHDTRGKEGITPEDCTLTEAAFREVADSFRQIAGMVIWTATTRPAGLLAGLPLVQRLQSSSGLMGVGPRIGGMLRAA